VAQSRCIAAFTRLKRGLLALPITLDSGRHAIVPAPVERTEKVVRCGEDRGFTALMPWTASPEPIANMSRGRGTVHTPTSDATWRSTTDPHGFFRVEIPASWSAHQSSGTLTRSLHGRSWEGRSFTTQLAPPTGDGTSPWHMGVSIRIERFGETPPLIFRDFDEPTDASFLRAYPITEESNWLSCTSGNLRVHVQYQIAHLSNTYHPWGWEPPAPLSPAERQERLALVRRITASFELLADEGENREG
jgi:hypothetical protein